jgi:hypothetical protein
MATLIARRPEFFMLRTQFNRRLKMKNIALLLFVGLIALVAPLSPVFGADNVYLVEKNFNKVMPVFMPGHAGDPAWVEGFVIGGDIFYDGAKVGTVTGEVWLWNPPLAFNEAYQQVGMVITNTITALGNSTFEVHAQGVALGSSTTAASGDVTVTWSGSVANGTGFFANNYGVSAGAVSANMFTQTAIGDEIVRVRSGF